MLQYRERYSDKMPPRLLKGIEDSANITQETYRAALTERERFRSMHDELAKRADGIITLSSPRPGPIAWTRAAPSSTRASSILGAPAINLPCWQSIMHRSAYIARPLASGRAPDSRRSLARRGAFPQSRVAMPSWHRLRIDVSNYVVLSFRQDMA